MTKWTLLLDFSLLLLLLFFSLSRLQVFLNTYGIQTQTPQQVEPIQIWPQKELVKVTQLSITQSSISLSVRWLEGCGLSQLPPGETRGALMESTVEHSHAS